MSLMANRKAVVVPMFAAFVFGLYPASAQLAYQDGANASFVILVITFFSIDGAWGLLLCI